MNTHATGVESNDPRHIFRAGAMEVRVYDEEKVMAKDAASIARALLLEALKARGTAAVVFAAANSQIQFLDALARVEGLDWSRMTFFHMDEYLGLDREHPASFRRFLRERVAERLRPGQFHYMAGDAIEPMSECDRYTRLLEAQPIDLCCLGIGENGHIAFNDPPVADFRDPRAVKIVKLDEACRRQQVGEGHYPNLEAVPQYALTLTIPALCAARRMLCIVPEKRKAAAVKAALEGDITTACPASWLRNQSHATLFLDGGSSSHLTDVGID